MPDTASSPSSSSRNQMLEDAWFRFAKYDKNASIAQKRFIRQRCWILILGVAATTLGVAYSVIEKNLESRQWVLPEGVAQDKFLSLLHVPVLAVPILLGVLVAISVKFNMGISWVMLRSSAEAIKKEIYRYRMQVGEYSPEKSTPAESRDVHLARTLKLVSKRLMGTAVNQTDLLAYEGSLPPKYGTPDGDNGFSDLTAEEYLVLRVEDQFNYYQKKAARLGKDVRRFQLMIFLLSAVGTLFAGLGFDVWIAVSSALAASVTAYLEFRRVEINVVLCNISAADLYDIRVWWHTLSPEARTEKGSIETLVISTEAVLQVENEGWLQEMREALAAIYGDKKDRNAHDGYKLLDGVDPALQPSAIANLPTQDASATPPSKATVKPEAKTTLAEPTATSEPASSQAVDSAAVHAEPTPSKSTANFMSDPTKVVEPDSAGNVSDPTAEAVR